MSDNMPILIDSESESSMEQDGEEKIERKVSNATQNATKSLFDITLENCNCLVINKSKLFNIFL